jgi:hypothetical protein
MMFTIEYVFKFDEYNRPVRSWSIESVKALKLQLDYMRSNRGFCGRGTYRRWKITRDVDGVVIAQWHSK